MVYVYQSELLDLGNGAPVEYVDKFEAELTAYTYNEVGDSITASGEAARVGYVAVDRSVIPMHSYLYIVTDSGFVYGYCYAKDVGASKIAHSSCRVKMFVHSSPTAIPLCGRISGLML